MIAPIFRNWWHASIPRRDELHASLRTEVIVAQSVGRVFRPPHSKGKAAKNGFREARNKPQRAQSSRRYSVLLTAKSFVSCANSSDQRKRAIANSSGSSHLVGGPAALPPCALRVLCGSEIRYPTYKEIAPIQSESWTDETRDDNQRCLASSQLLARGTTAGQALLGFLPTAGGSICASADPLDQSQRTVHR